MKIHVQLELPELEQALAAWMPAGLNVGSVHIDQDRLRIEGRGPFGVSVALTAALAITPGRLVASGIEIEGPVFVRGMALAKLRARLAEARVARGPFRVRGEDEGRRVVVEWDAADV